MRLKNIAKELSVYKIEIITGQVMKVIQGGRTISIKYW
jgi:hypothetical protein